MNHHASFHHRGKSSPRAPPVPSGAVVPGVVLRVAAQDRRILLDVFLQGELHLGAGGEHHGERRGKMTGFYTRCWVFLMDPQNGWCIVVFYEFFLMNRASTILTETPIFHWKKTP